MPQLKRRVFKKTAMAEEVASKMVSEVRMRAKSKAIGELSPSSPRYQSAVRRRAKAAVSRLFR